MESSEILTSVPKQEQTVTPGFLGQQQPFVTALVKPSTDRDHRDSHGLLFRKLEIVKGYLDQERWKILPWIPLQAGQGKPIHSVQEVQARQ